MSTIIIKTEEDAYEFLEKSLKGELVLKLSDIQFEGWPKLKMHLVGDKYHQTITPPVMKGLLEFQRSLYRSYAISRYNTPNIRILSREEREEFEIEVKVSDGSSGYEIDLQELLIRLIEQVGAKMEPVHLITLVLGIGVLYTGQSALRLFLDNRKEVREKELRSEDQRAQIEALNFSSEQETKRAQIIAGLVDKYPRMESIRKDAYQANTALLKGVASADEGLFRGVSLDGDIARVLTTNARLLSEQIRLDGDFRIMRVDSSDPAVFRVRVLNIESGEQIDAIVQELSLSRRARLILQEAEWNRQPVRLLINAKENRGEIRSAIILRVDRVPEPVNEELESN